VPNKKDISQIRKYLNGELDARAMHELERRAQDDPMLMDALEGYERAKGDQKANLADLTNRLQQRTEAKVKRMFPWVPVSVAASILIVLGVGMWMITNKQPAKPQQTAEVVKSEVKEKPAEKQLLKRDSAPTISAPAAAKYNAKQSVADKEAMVADANSAPAAVEPQEYKSTDQLKNVPPKIDTALFVRKAFAGRSVADSTSVGYLSPNVVAKRSFNADQPLKTKAEGVTFTQKAKPNNNAELAKMGLPPNPEIAQTSLDKPRYQPRQDSPALNDLVVTNKYASKDKKAINGSPASINPGAPVSGKVLTGKIISKDDGQPIVGATVKVKGANFGVVTNVEGKFVLRNVGGDQTIAVAYIGYNSKNVSINNKDSLNIVLEPNSSSLNEVVTTGYSTVHKDNDAPFDDPKPKDGWPAFKKYISENAKSSDGKTGRVRLSFTVDPNGNFSDFKVRKSLSKVADQKAIDLIENGPKWIGATDGRAHEVKFNVKF